MKKTITIFLILLFVFSKMIFAKGGLGPCLASCCIGPRIGLEMNEGSRIRNTEWLGFIVGAVASSMAGRLIYVIDPVNGRTMNEIRKEENLGGVDVKAAKPEHTDYFLSGLGSFCIGPRVGLEMNDGRKIRTVEWFLLAPIVSIVPAVIISAEAYSGKTMSEIAQEENLDQ